MTKEIRIRKQLNGKIRLHVTGKQPSKEMDDPLEIAAEIGREKEASARLIELLLSDNPSGIIGESVIEYYEKEE